MDSRRSIYQCSKLLVTRFTKHFKTHKLTVTITNMIVFIIVITEFLPVNRSTFKAGKSFSGAWCCYRLEVHLHILSVWKLIKRKTALASF